MFRLRSKSGDESVFRTPEEIRAALLSGFVTPDAQIWDAELKGWVPLLEHALYQQIAATPGGRKSNAVKAPPSSPTTAKPVQKLVIRRPGETATPAAPTPPPAPKPPAPKPPVADEGPELEMLDIDLSMDEVPEPEAAPAPPPAPKPAPTPPPAAVQPPTRPTPPPAPPAPAPPPPPPRVSAPRVSVPAATPARPSTPVMRSLEPVNEGGSKKGLIIAAVVVIAAAGGGAFALLRGKGAEPVAAVDSSAFVAPVDSAPDSTAALTDSTKVDSTTPAVAVVDTTTPVAAPPVAVDTTPAAPVIAIPGVPFAPAIERGFTSWNARPATAQPLSVAELEAVRLRYVSAQSRALEQYEAGLEATGFSDMFDPARVGRQDRREESLEAVEAGREALQNFRRRQAAIDFAYTDTLRQALPAGSDEPDLRTFGPVLRESAAQAAVTDSLVTAMNDIYTLLVNSPGGFTLRGRELFFKDAAKGEQYRLLQERLTAQLGRLRARPGSDIPPAMGAILRGIGVPR